MKSELFIQLLRNVKEEGIGSWATCPFCVELNIRQFTVGEGCLKKHCPLAIHEFKVGNAPCSGVEKGFRGLLYESSFKETIDKFTMLAKHQKLITKATIRRWINEYSY